MSYISSSDEAESWCLTHPLRCRALRQGSKLLRKRLDALQLISAAGAAGAVMAALGVLVCIPVSVEPVQALLHMAPVWLIAVDVGGRQVHEATQPLEGQGRICYIPGRLHRQSIC